jgi:hypothetical protein
MSVDALIAEAKQLIAKAEDALETIENAEPTQLRIVVNRLRLFLEQHGLDAVEERTEHSVEPEPERSPTLKSEPLVEEPAKQGEPGPEAELVDKATPKRRGRPPKAKA